MLPAQGLKDPVEGVLPLPTDADSNPELDPPFFDKLALLDSPLPLTGWSRATAGAMDEAVSDDFCLPTAGDANMCLDALFSQFSSLSDISIPSPRGWSGYMD